MTQIGIGIIGAGRHAKANIYPSLDILGVQIGSVCTQHIETAQQISEQYRIPNTYTDHREMLKQEDLDVVFVVLPENLQAEVVIDCLRAGKHVFVEKPLGLTVAEAVRVAEISAQTGKHVTVGFMKRYSPAYVEAKRVMSDTENFGSVLSILGKFSARPMGDEEFYLKNAAIHFIDLIR